MNLRGFATRPVIIAPDVIFWIETRSIAPDELAVVVVIGIIPVHRRLRAELVRLASGGPAQPVIGKAVGAIGRVHLLGQFAARVVEEVQDDVGVGGAGVLDLLRDESAPIIGPIVRGRVG